MTSPYLQLEHDEYGIGYTPFFYCTAMVRDLLNVRMLSIDGVTPKAKNRLGETSIRGTKKQAQYKTKCEVFSILAYKYAAFIRSVQKYGYIYIMYAKFHMKFLHIS